MPTDPQWTTEAEAALQLHGGDKAAAARALGLSRETFRDRILAPQRAARRAALRGEVSAPPLPPAAVPPPGFIITRNAAAYGPDGTLERQWVGSRPDAGEEYEVPQGHVVKGESALLDPDGRVLTKWVKTSLAPSQALFVDAMVARFQEYAGAAPLLPVQDAQDDALLTVYAIPDLHFGMYSWRPETGDNYDVELATALARQSLGSLVARSAPSRRAVILVLGDFFHQNDQKNATPNSGHRLDVDGRWGRVFEAGAQLSTDMVELVAQKHEEVEVVFIPGNHDEDAAVCLRVALSLFYSKNQRVSVYNEPGLHWYRRFGKVLLGATHGHTMKPSQMAMMLACDRAKDWGETDFRHFFFGHIHHESAREVGPVRVESFNTPAPRDAYAQAGGYRSGRALNALTFHVEHGEVGRHRVNILPPLE
jgi:predicted phosphodiesterase